MPQSQGINETVPVVAGVNNCFGTVLGFNAGVEGLIGIAFTGTPADMVTSCKTLFPLIAYPPFAFRLGLVGDCDNPTFALEIGFGFSGIGLNGCSACATNPFEV